MGRSPVAFTAAEIDRYIDLKATGLTNSQITEAMPGRTRDQIRHLGDRLAHVERTTLVADGRITWTSYNVKWLRQLHADGLDIVQIAKEMRSTYCAISCAVAKFCPARAEKLRRCMMCRDDFPSAGTGHRICDRCKSSESYRCAA